MKSKQKSTDNLVGAILCQQTIDPLIRYACHKTILPIRLCSKVPLSDLPPHKIIVLYAKLCGIRVYCRGYRRRVLLVLHQQLWGLTLAKRDVALDGPLINWSL